MNLPALTAPILGAGISLLLLLALLRRPDLLPDQPNQRSLHVHPVPRTGGIAVITGCLGTVALLLPDFRSFCLSASLIALVSLIDDWKRLSPLPRFGAQAFIAAGYSLYSLGFNSIAETAFLILSIVWVANLFNFMDGSDGLAGGMAVIGFACYAVGAWMGGHVSFALLCGTIAAATLPFLAANFHPARIFMGDIGAVTLGFAAAALGALGWREGIWSPFFPVFAFSPFIADASLTLLHRVLARQRFWEPHRDHYYQKLVRMGMGHRNTALAEYAVMLISATCAIATLFLGGVAQLIAIVVWGAILMLIAHQIDIHWIRYQSEAA